MDRFIPNRAVTNMRIAEALLTEPQREESPETVSPSKIAYRKLLRDTLLQGRTRILCFGNTPPRPTEVQPQKQHRCIPQVPMDIYEVPSLISDKRINLLDWGSNNLLAIALDNVVYIQKNRTLRLFSTVSQDYDPISSVSWAPDGDHIAVGFENNVRVYDTATNKQIRGLAEIHPGLIGSLAWNNNDILTTGGGRDGTVLNHDLRIRNYVVGVHQGHEGAICGLKWSSSGVRFASGGDDKLLNIWDLRQYTPVHKFTNHTATVRAIDWCPFQDNLLASGGGTTDNSIKIWNISTGKCENSVDTGSQVCNVLWSKTERELLSSHGQRKNQLTLWKYSSMEKITELTGHSSPVIYLAQSPDGCKVASASGDQTMMIWSISTNEDKKKIKSFFGPCNMYSNIR